MDARAAWTRLPAWARWALGYAAALALCLLLGALTPWDAGAFLFLGGALAILASAWMIRLGGPRSAVTLRAPDGKILRREPMPEDERRMEIRRGLAVFALGLALWAAMGLLLRAPLPF